MLLSCTLLAAGKAVAHMAIESGWRMDVLYRLLYRACWLSFAGLDCHAYACMQVHLVGGIFSFPLLAACSTCKSHWAPYSTPLHLTSLSQARHKQEQVQRKSHACGIKQGSSDGQEATQVAGCINTMKLQQPTRHHACCCLKYSLQVTTCTAFAAGLWILVILLLRHAHRVCTQCKRQPLHIPYALNASVVGPRLHYPRIHTPATRTRLASRPSQHPHT